MQITDVTVTRSTPIRGITDYSAEIQIVEIETDCDITGIGFASAPFKIGDLVTRMILDLLKPRLIGKVPNTNHKI